MTPDSRLTIANWRTLLTVFGIAAIVTAGVLEIVSLNYHQVTTVAITGAKPDLTTSTTVGPSAPPTAVVSAALGAGVVLLLVAAFFTRITKISALGSEIGLFSSYQAADKEEESSEEKLKLADFTEGNDDADKWLAARLQLEAKIAYLAKHTLPDHLPIIDPQANDTGYSRPYANVGSLLYDKLLSEGEAQRASLLLSTPWPVIASGPAKMEKSLVRDAEDLARTVRAKVFRRLVHRYIENQNHGDLTEKEDQLILYHDRARITIWPTWGSANADLTKKRIARLNDKDRGIVVIPKFPKTESITPQTSNGATLLVTLDNLGPALRQVIERNNHAV
jgi:hypothetical protein